MWYCGTSQQRIYGEEANIRSTTDLSVTQGPHLLRDLQKRCFVVGLNKQQKGSHLVQSRPEPLKTIGELDAFWHVYEP